MTCEEMGRLFDKYADDYLEFKNVAIKLSARPDLHAFMLLDRLVPSDEDIIADAQHDEFWLSVDVDDLSTIITPDQVRELVMCGVRYADDSLCMFT